VPLDGIPFHPYYTVKDYFRGACLPDAVRGRGVLRTHLGDLFLEKANFEPANPLSTPDPISPSWYFTPYYAILRSVPDKGIGRVLMLIAVSAFFFLPWLDRSPVKSIRYRGWIFRTFSRAVHALVPGPDVPGVAAGPGHLRDPVARVCVPYFAFFLLMPIYTRIDPVKPVPERVTFHA
jgi:ubiquinol-cytochrome c reductase cytochrome b subunit